ncbi:hypothetical protein [Mesorhizobium sp.]|uniref:hypothetical protein n=1 Tax=Mesorhizobium sp. TaxID=1871066 RepID=UPI000FE82575|nr:hypothetical protein [Mesorhizobium sp.]RWP47977.1 MAG: hypothetical protein EOR05_15565 [Mesorhizobium sp.]
MTAAIIAIAHQYGAIDSGNAVLGNRDEFTKVPGRPHALQCLDSLSETKAIDEGDGLFEIAFRNEVVETGMATPRLSPAI